MSRAIIDDDVITSLRFMVSYIELLLIYCICIYIFMSYLSVASLSRTGEAERRGRSTLLDSMVLGEEELKEKWLHERARPDW
jgi:hypothetical protein